MKRGKPTTLLVDGAETDPAGTCTTPSAGGEASGARHTKVDRRASASILRIDTEAAEAAGRRMGPAVLSTCDDSDRKNNGGCCVAIFSSLQSPSRARSNSSRYAEAEGHEVRSRRPQSLALVLARGTLDSDSPSTPSPVGTDGRRSPTVQQIMARMAEYDGRLAEGATACDAALPTVEGLPAGVEDGRKGAPCSDSQNEAVNSGAVADDADDIAKQQRNSRLSVNAPVRKKKASNPSIVGGGAPVRKLDKVYPRMPQLGKRKNHHVGLGDFSTMDKVIAAMSEAMAVEAAAAEAEAAFKRRTAAGGNTMGGGIACHPMTSGDLRQGSNNVGHGKIVGCSASEIETPPHRVCRGTAADVGGSTHAEEHTKRAFREADSTYRSLCEVYNVLESRWEKTLATFQTASEAVAAPRAELYRAHRAYDCASRSLQAREDLVSDAESQYDRADDRLRRAAEVVRIAKRKLQRSGKTLRKFERATLPVKAKHNDTVSPAAAGEDAQPAQIHGNVQGKRKGRINVATGVRKGATLDSPEGGDSGKVGAKLTSDRKALHDFVQSFLPIERGDDLLGSDSPNEEEPRPVRQEDNEGEKPETAGRANDLNAITPRGKNERSEYDIDKSTATLDTSVASPERRTVLAHLALDIQIAWQDLANAKADKRRAQADVDLAFLLVGARTAGDWSIAAEECLTAAKEYRRARDKAAPKVKSFIEEARAFKNLEALAISGRERLAQAWRARESAQIAVESVATGSDMVVEKSGSEAASSGDSCASMPKANGRGESYALGLRKAASVGGDGGGGCAKVVPE